MSDITPRKQATRDRILDTAAKALRTDGFAAVGVADVMQRSGLTHGGFYSHFPSRTALLVEALARAGEDSERRRGRAIAMREARGMPRFDALVDAYLSESHLKDPGTGCPVAALASELPRQPAEVRAVGAEWVRSLLDEVRQALPARVPDDTVAAITAQLVGALQTARALGAAQGRRHLASVRRDLVAQHSTLRR